MSGKLAERTLAAEEPKTSPRVDNLGYSIESAAGTGSSLRRRLILADAAAVLVGFAMAFAVLDIFRPTLDSIVVDHILLMVLGLPGFAFGALRHTCTGPVPTSGRRRRR